MVGLAQLKPGVVVDEAVADGVSVAEGVSDAVGESVSVAVDVGRVPGWCTWMVSVALLGLIFSAARMVCWPVCQL